MKLFYFRSDIGNFGDDLNAWLWPKLLGDLNEFQEDHEFVGIGSILDQRLNTKLKKIVFGSGVRTQSPEIDISNCDILFVRGPLSSEALDGVPYICDSAYCLGLLSMKEFSKTKKYKRSIIPYFRHLKSYDWRLFEKLTGIHFINVTDSVEKVLEEIQASEKIICGAMHGAIVADYFRVPWVRLRFGLHGHESLETSNLKWNDWLRSMEIYDELENVEIKHEIIKRFETNSYLKKKIYFFEIMQKIKRVEKYYLSDTLVLDEKIKQLGEVTSLLKKRYGNIYS